MDDALVQEFMLDTAILGLLGMLAMCKFIDMFGPHLVFKGQADVELAMTCSEKLKHNDRIYRMSETLSRYERGASAQRH